MENSIVLPNFVLVKKTGRMPELGCSPSLMEVEPEDSGLDNI
jgi:hypothetical protein